MKSVLFYTIFLLCLTVCNYAQQPNNFPSTKDLKTPKKEKPEKIDYTRGTISIVLFSKELWVCYPDTSVQNGSIFSPQDFSIALNRLKKEYGDSLRFLVKPTNYASPETTIAALDYIEGQQIKRYQVVSLSDREEKILYSGQLAKLLPEQVQSIVVEAPTTVETVTILNEPTFYFYLKEDSTIWYKIDSSNNDNNYKKLDPRKEETLAKVIAGLKKDLDQEKRKYGVMIVGNKNAPYVSFELIMSALRKNELYKYNLITKDN